MDFRKTKVDEIDRVMEILLDGKAALASLGIDQWQGEEYPAREIVVGDVDGGVSYVVEDARGHLAATCMVSFAGEPDYDEIEGSWLTAGLSTDPGYAVVHRVAVAADSTGKGAARFMLTSAEKIARERGARSVRVDTIQHRADAAPDRLVRLHRVRHHPHQLALRGACARPSASPSRS